MPLDKRFQEVLLSRLEGLSQEELTALDQGINAQAALVLLYRIMPEVDFVLLKGLTALEGHQYRPELALGGEAMQQPQQQPQQQGQQPPQMQLPRGGALGGLGGNSIG